MKVLVIGAGALGCLLGARIASAGHSVRFVVRTAEQAAHLRQTGMQLSSGSRQLRISNPMVSAAQPLPEQPELTLVTVKSYDTPGVIAALPTLGLGKTPVLTLQNGLGNIEQFVRAIGSNRALGGTTTEGALSLGRGIVRHAGDGRTVVGALSGQREGIDTAVQLLQSAGFYAEATSNLRGEVWSKALINSAINPLTALTGLTNGDLLRSPPFSPVLDAIIAEGVGVAKHAGVRLRDGDLVVRTREVLANTAENRSSMLQDIERRRRTEIDALNGAIAQVASQTGTSAPLNVLLTAAMHALERDSMKESRSSTPPSIPPQLITQL